MQLVDDELASKKFIAVCSESYISVLRKFIYDTAVAPLAELRGKHGMYDALQKEEEWDDDTDLSMGASSQYQTFLFQAQIY